jgi:thiazole/oxazole-forming peptide maturase SagD family component
MKLSYYPSSTHLLHDVFQAACGEHVGILQSVIVRPVKYGDGLDLISITGKMPDYPQAMHNIPGNTQYHLCGYGSYDEEALVRLVGEAIERYSLMVSFKTFGADRVAFGSYRELKNRGKVLPFEYLRLFSEDDYRKLENTDFRGAQALTEDDEIGWILCPSLFRPGDQIWMPLQMMFVGYKPRPGTGEVRFTPGFSTGTAAHKSLTKALSSALLEFIEIDALMVHWYTKNKACTLLPNDGAIVERHIDMLGPQSQYEVRVHDIGVIKGMRAHVAATTIINKKDQRPFVSYGAQASLNPMKAFYRSFMESIAIEYMGIYGPLYSPKEYLRESGNETITDLDTNAAYWANPGHSATKRAFLDGLVSGEKRALTALPNHETGNDEEDLVRLISDLSTVSEYAVYLDITPPETRSQGWYVMRAFVPELVCMCIPGVPYGNHPRWQDFGGKKHDIPHPLP